MQFCAVSDTCKELQRSSARPIFTFTAVTPGFSSMSDQNRWSSIKEKCSVKSILAVLLIFSVVFLGYIVYSYRTQPWQMLTPEKYEDPGPYYVAYPYKYQFILDQPNKCSRTNPFVVVIVPVAPHNLEARDAIRSSWGNDSLVQKGMVLVLFLLGVPGLEFSESQKAQLLQENLRHQDLLQSNFIDSYKNLTIKTMVMLEWLRKRCPHALYAVKVDSDVLLNLNNLVKMLISPNISKTNYLTGLVWYNSIVMRNPNNRFYLPHEVYPNSVYPPYPLGMCYIMSLDLPDKILQVSKKMKPIFIEDAYIGLCLKQLNITPTNPPDINQFVVHPPNKYNRCYYTGLIAVMTNGHKDLLSFWTDMHNPAPPC